MGPKTSRIRGGINGPSDAQERRPASIIRGDGGEGGIYQGLTRVLDTPQGIRRDFSCNEEQHT